MAELNPSSTHPPLPPTTEDDRLDWLRLLRSRRVGPATFWRLIAEHGTAAAALAALPGIAAAAGVSGYEVCPVAVVRAEIAAARACGARSVIPGDRAWPLPLNDLPDCPPFLWARGDLSLLARPMVALVGARAASSAGERMAKHLATDLSAAGYVIVSGLARGIDGCAHKGALAGGTVAVLAGGVDIVYPPENKELLDQIATAGLVLSEQPIGLDPLARHFPLRNRIISGLSRGVVVVEAAAKSGSLITARDALDQGRDVMAVPGHPLDGRSAGCNLLIRDGAPLIRDAGDVLAVIGAAADVRDYRDRPIALRTAPAVRQSQAGPDVAPVMNRATVQSHRIATDEVTGSTDRAGHAPSQAAQRPLETANQPQPTVPSQRGARPLARVAALHRMILDRLSLVPVAEDQLIRDLAAPTHDIAPALLDLEMDGKVLRQPGGLFVRVH
jgi:DNA processing protein